MPQAIHRISIFVAASSDVAQERDALKEVVAELEGHYDSWGIDLQVINWQSNVIPDFGIDPQDVINRQLRFDGIDIFIGIVWGRIGTATPRAISGTVEEVNNALASRRQTGRPWRIMFFLCDRPTTTQSADAFQVQEAAKFKQWIDSCALCKHYSDLQAFKDEAHNALSMVINEFLQHQAQWQLPPSPQPLPVRWQWADPYQMNIVVICPWCAGYGPVGTIPAASYRMYQGQIWRCPRCAMPHFFP